MSYKDLEFGISCIDTKHMRENFVASYLIADNNEVAFVDSGCYLSVVNLLEVLDNKKIDYNLVKYIFVTHAHLDHAGGAGELLRYLPNAKVVANKSCAKHLINPEKLKAGVIAVYGELFFNKYLGDIIPIPDDKIIIADNQKIILGNRELQLFTTYGHAYHHYVIFDKRSSGVFSGDTLGVSYSELNNNKVLIFPPTTPTQFDPAVWKESIDFLTNMGINKAYLTHYNEIKWNIEIANQLKQRIDDFCEIAKNCQQQKNRVKVIQQQLLDYLLCELLNINIDEKTKYNILNSDLVICAQGLNIWLNKS